MIFGHRSRPVDILFFFFIYNFLFYKRCQVNASMYTMYTILFLKFFHVNLNQVNVCFLADSLSFVLQSSVVPLLTQTALSRGHHMLSLSNYFTNRSETAFVSVAAGSEGYPGSTTPKHWGKLFGSQPWGHISGSGDNFIIHITLRRVFLLELWQRTDLPSL